MKKRPSLAQLRATHAKKNESRQNNDDGDSLYYQFWKMEEDEFMSFRPLPDKNLENENIFYVDKLMHRLEIGDKEEKVACPKMYGESCDICDLSQAYYKRKDKDNGKKYYRECSMLCYGPVVRDPLSGTEYEAGTDPRILQLGWQIRTKLLDEVFSTPPTDEEELEHYNGPIFEHDPWDIENGYNFTVRKKAGSKGADYKTGSGFARKPKPIPSEYLNEDGEIELIDLRTLLPKNPGSEKVSAMLDAHLHGEKFDHKKWHEDNDNNSESDDSDSDSGDESDLPPDPPKTKKSDNKNTVKAPLDVTGDDDDDDDDEDPFPTSSKKTVTESDESSKMATEPASADDLDEDEDADDIFASLRNRLKAGQ